MKYDCIKTAWDIRNSFMQAIGRNEYGIAREKAADGLFNMKFGTAAHKKKEFKFTVPMLIQGIAIVRSYFYVMNGAGQFHGAMLDCLFQITGFEVIDSFHVYHRFP